VEEVETRGRLEIKTNINTAAVGFFCLTDRFLKSYYFGLGLWQVRLFASKVNSY